jgi:feruloyl esterase
LARFTRRKPVFALIPLVAASLGIAASSVAHAAGPLPAVGCESLTSVSMTLGRVTAAQSITGGTFTPPGATRAITNLPPFCRVQVLVDPQIRIEVWLPISSWNGKLLGVAGGGTQGSIVYGTTVDPSALTNPVGVSGLADGVQRGYAVMSTDGGHVGTDDTWWNDLGRAVDLGYRAGHEMALKGKLLTNAYYGQAPAYSYFTACSGGGRMGMMSAQRNPEDYDGIVAGAPGFNWSDLMAAELWAAKATTETPASNIPNSKLALITNAAVQACDAIDGLQDGIIDDPRKCNFDPGVLQCQGADGPDCLTAGQVTAVRKVYQGAHYPDGTRISYGHTPGSETGWANLYTGITDMNNQGGASDRQYFRLMVFNDPLFDLRTFDFNNHLKLAKDRAAWILDATSTKLDGLRARGGKLITVYGWADGLAPPGATADYHEQVVNDTQGGRQAVDGFYRLFMVPGMGHCSGGNVPNKFDTLKVLEAWVERGVAPDAIVAAQTNPDGTVKRTRPVCAYPKVARYDGHGSQDDAANFSCKNPRD